MKVLVIGSGGREHALCWKIAQSPLVDKVYCAPGNGGMHREATCVEIPAHDIPALLAFAGEQAIDLTVVGPEAPLVDGIVDAFEGQGLSIFGPSQAAARLEGSKAFAKELMRELSIPTAAFEVFSDYTAARAYVEASAGELVIKADGLAAGKGVIVTSTKAQALGALDSIMRQRAFGEAGGRVVVEERLQGEEVSFIAITDGEYILPLASSQDHKPAYDNDEGPNTGGMGAYSPAPVLDEACAALVVERILYPLIRGLRRKGILYRGVIYAGLMLTREGPFVLEYNVRLGDPETQPLLMRLKGDLVPLLLRVASGEGIADVQLLWEDGPSVCVVMASPGYPGPYTKGTPITGIEAAEAAGNVKVFHAGTTLTQGRLLSSGGRVLGVTAQGADLTSAIARAYVALESIGFEGAHYRTDIGLKALRRPS